MSCLSTYVIKLGHIGTLAESSRVNLVLSKLLSAVFAAQLMEDSA